MKRRGAGAGASAEKAVASADVDDRQLSAAAVARAQRKAEGKPPPEDDHGPPVSGKAFDALLIFIIIGLFGSVAIWFTWKFSQPVVKFSI